MQIVADLQGQDVALNKYREFLHDELFHGRFNNQVIVSTMYILYEACNYMTTRFL